MSHYIFYTIDFSIIPPPHCSRENNCVYVYSTKKRLVGPSVKGSEPTCSQARLCDELQH